MMAKPELLNEKILSRRGSFKRVRRWWRGIHPDRGTITKGWTGWETVEEADRVLPIKTFTVSGGPERPRHHPEAMPPSSRSRKGG